MGQILANGRLIDDATGALVVRDSVDTPVALPFATGWANTGGAFRNCAYYKAGGRVYLTGTATASASNTTGVVATLPVGYRPSAQLFVRASSSAGQQDLNVKANGDITTATGALGYISLDGLSFLAEG